MIDIFFFYFYFVVFGGLEVRLYKIRDIFGIVEIFFIIWFKIYKGDKNNRISWIDICLIVIYM